MEKVSLCRFLKEKRQEAGLSQISVAKELGYKTPQFISNWERGISEPPLKCLPTIASLYNISTEEMFGKIRAQVLKKVSRDLRRKFTAISRFKKDEDP